MFKQGQMLFGASQAGVDALVVAEPEPFVSKCYTEKVILVAAPGSDRTVEWEVTELFADRDEAIRRADELKVDTLRP